MTVRRAHIDVTLPIAILFLRRLQNRLVRSIAQVPTCTYRSTEIDRGIFSYKPSISTRNTPGTIHPNYIFVVGMCFHDGARVMPFL